MELLRLPGDHCACLLPHPCPCPCLTSHWSGFFPSGRGFYSRHLSPGKPPKHSPVFSYTRVHRDLAPTRLAFAANLLNLLWVHHSRPFPFSVKAACAGLAAGGEALHALSVSVRRCAVGFGGAWVIQHCLDWLLGCKHRAGCIPKHGHPWHHSDALSSPTLCCAGAIPAPPSAWSFSDREGHVGRVKLQWYSPTEGPGLPVPAQLLAATCSVYPPCTQPGAVSVPVVQELASPQPLTAAALSPHGQGDGVPPLPVGLISLSASWDIPLPPLAAGHIES